MRHFDKDEKPKGCSHPEYIHPITPNKARNRRPVASSFGSQTPKPGLEWCELCWNEVPVGTQ